jgi:hypothetical protein
MCEREWEAMNILVILAWLGRFLPGDVGFLPTAAARANPQLRRWFKNWMFKGLLTPFLLWMLSSIPPPGIGCRL